MKLIKRGAVYGAILALAVSAVYAQGQPQAQAPAKEDQPDPTLTMKIGDPKLKDKTMEVGLGAIVSGGAGAAVAFDQMIPPRCWSPPPSGCCWGSGRAPCCSRPSAAQT